MVNTMDYRYCLRANDDANTLSFRWLFSVWRSRYQNISSTSLSYESGRFISYMCKQPSQKSLERIILLLLGSSRVTRKQSRQQHQQNTLQRGLNEQRYPSFHTTLKSTCCATLFVSSAFVNQHDRTGWVGGFYLQIRSTVSFSSGESFVLDIPIVIRYELSWRWKSPASPSRFL